METSGAFKTSITGRSPPPPLPPTPLCFHAMKFILFVCIRRASGAGAARSPGHPAMTWSEQDVRACPCHRRSLSSRLQAYLVLTETGIPAPASASRSRVSTRPFSLSGRPTPPTRELGRGDCPRSTLQPFHSYRGSVLGDKERERARVSTVGRQESERDI
jgi:hypothetical protein